MRSKDRDRINGLLLMITINGAAKNNPPRHPHNSGRGFASKPATGSKVPINPINAKPNTIHKAAT